MIWARLSAVVLLLALLAGAALGCFDADSSANCPQFDECPLCTMEAACGFCLETNLCIPDGQPCGGDRAQTPDMCEEHP